MRKRIAYLTVVAVAGVAMIPTAAQATKSKVVIGYHTGPGALGSVR